VLDTVELIDAARRRTGHDDFGEDSWREGLDVLLRALSSDVVLNDIGVGVFTDQITGHLANRLEVEHWHATHPEIGEQEIVAPLFGLGLPRTGSTATSFLLACDPTRRALRTWEASAPCPPPETATEHTDPRIEASEAGIQVIRELFPDFVGMLPTSATGPQECIVPMAMTFRSQVFEGMALLPTYTEWILHCDMEPAYRYHRRLLQLLQWRCPPTRWWLKSPAHMTSIDALDAVYPDARFVMTHRDLGRVLPSVCAVKQALSSPLAERLDLVALGDHEVSLWSASVERLIRFRDAGNEHRFSDLQFAEVQADPLGAVERLYRDLGDELTAETRGRMADWWESSAADRATGPRPDAAEYGLDLVALRERFASYHQRFAVPVS
jgi:hypothetical protein